MTKTILNISSSVRGDESVTAGLVAELLQVVKQDSDQVVQRNLVDSAPLLTPPVAAELTVAVEERTTAAVPTLAFSDKLVDELKQADILIVSAPIYNFSVPANLKAWADLVARAGITFSYGDSGPVGLLADRPTYIVSASGGTEIGGPQDFGTTWLRHFLGFIGIHNVTVIAAGQMAMDADAAMAAARSQIQIAA